MSTRSIISEPCYRDEEDEDGGDCPHGWRGRYHHSDGYPSGVGQTLWQLYRGHFHQDVAAMRRYLLHEHSGWSTINGADFALPPGFIENVADRYETDALGRVDWTKPPKPRGPACYCHGDRNEEGWWITDLAETWCEWRYLLGDDALGVYEIRYALDDGDARTKAETHRGTFPWTGPQPPWHKLDMGTDDDADEDKVPENAEAGA